jgi:hypothetical protein
MRRIGFFKMLLIVTVMIVGVTLVVAPAFAGPQPEAGLKETPPSSKTPVLTPKTLMMKNEELVEYKYQAHTVRSTGSKPRILTIREIRWSCEETLCTTKSRRPMLMLPPCKALVSQVGPVTLFGRPGMFLSKRLLRQCNRHSPGKKLPEN